MYAMVCFWIIFIPNVISKNQWIDIMNIILEAIQKLGGSKLVRLVESLNR